MSIAALTLVPGVDVEKTPALNQAGITISNLIRYEEGLAQKIGGWDKYYPFAFSAVPRDLHAWEDLNSVGNLSVGTATQLGVIANNALITITPQTLISDFTPDFTTSAASPLVEVNDPNIANVTILDAVFFNTPISVDGVILFGAYQISVVTGTTTYQITAIENAVSGVSDGGAVPQFDTTLGSAEVTVTLAAHGLSPGQKFTFPIPSTDSGITIVGTYPVTTVPSVDTFTIVADIQAVSTNTFLMNTGNAEILYYINQGPAATGSGYGIGGYGEGGYGTGVVPSGQTGIPITTTDYLTDNWGETLVANPRGGGIYYWEPRSGFANAAFISEAAPFNNGLFVAMPQQILVAWGTTASVYGQPIGVGNGIDPMLLRWSDIGNFFSWLPQSGSQAGSRRLSIGSTIKGAIQGPTNALIWTDLGLYAMQYLNYPLVWGFNLIGTGCGCVGAHAMGILAQNVYWMSSFNFYVLGGGGVSELPCPVWDVVFQDLDATNIEKVRAAPNSAFGEIAWYYPSLSGGTGENDSYVMYHASETAQQGRPVWSYGKLPRSAWIDQSVLGQPIGADVNGLIYQHETSYDADGQPLLAAFETGWFAISEGWDLTFIDQFWPDFRFKFFNVATAPATIQMTITTADYPNGPQMVSGPFSVTQASTFIGTRCRGRLVKIAVASGDTGTWWRMGRNRYRAAKAGKR